MCEVQEDVIPGIWDRLAVELVNAPAADRHLPPVDINDPTVLMIIKTVAEEATEETVEAAMIVHITKALPMASRVQLDIKTVNTIRRE